MYDYFQTMQDTNNFCIILFLKYKLIMGQFASNFIPWIRADMMIGAYRALDCNLCWFERSKVGHLYSMIESLASTSLRITEDIPYYCCGYFV